MTIEKALAELNEYGFHIVRIDDNQFVCHDTGLFGFAEEQDPFIVDAEDIIEIHEEYLG